MASMVDIKQHTSVQAFIVCVSTFECKIVFSFMSASALESVERTERGADRESKKFGDLRSLAIRSVGESGFHRVRLEQILIYIYIYIHTYIHICIYIYMFV